MTAEAVQAWLAKNAPDLPLIVVEETTATVDAAAKALGVEPGRIAKTLAVRAGEQTFSSSRAAMPGSTIANARTSSGRGPGCSGRRKSWR